MPNRRPKPPEPGPNRAKSGPKAGPKPADKPKVTYVYRRDAFNKVKLA